MEKRMKPYYQRGGIELWLGDCREVLPALAPRRFESCVTDPPYNLLQASRRGSGRSNNPDTPAGRHGAKVGGFMGLAWDATDVAFDPATWRLVRERLLPGAMLLSFGGTRTWHRLTCAVEDAGFEVRDTICWLYGSGFPKSLDVSKAIDKAAGAERTRHVVATRLGNAKRNGDGTQGVTYGDCHGGFRDESSPATAAAKLWDGWGTALKPAWEPVIVAMNPLDGTFAENALRHGVAGLNVDGGRIPIDGLEREIVDNRSGGQKNDNTGWQGPGKAREIGEKFQSHQAGRFPANVILDEEAARLLDEQSGELKSGFTIRRHGNKGRGMFPVKIAEGSKDSGYGDSGGASRFFYTAKAPQAERNVDLPGLPLFGVPDVEARNPHPTVKPLDLLKYLCILTKTPTGGTVLDPFAGSGSTLIGAAMAGRPSVGIEMEEKYAEYAAKRVDAWIEMNGPVKARCEDDP